MTNDDTISRIEAALSNGEFNFGEVCCGQGEWHGPPYDQPECCGRPLSCADDIRTLLDRLKAAEAENERLSVLAVDQKGVLRDLLADVAVMKQRLAEAKLEAARLRQAAIRAERKLTAYVGVCDGDKELTDAVLPMLRAAMRKEGDHAR
jgi:hypothetical protein